MLTICVLRSVFIPVIRKAVIRVHVVIRRGYHLPLSQPSITAVPERRATGWLSALRQCPIRTEGARSGGAESLLTLSLPLRAGRREIRPAYFRDWKSHALASGRYRHRGLPLPIPSASVITVVSVAPSLIGCYRYNRCHQEPSPSRCHNPVVPVITVFPLPFTGCLRYRPFR